MDTELIESKTPTDPAKKDWKAALDKRADTFADVLPPDVNAEDFIAVCKRAVMRDHKLVDCMNRNPAAAFGAFLDCARDGLMPDGREAHIDARRDKEKGVTAAYMPMRRGLVKMLYKSGKVRSVDLHVVYEGDDFEADLSEGASIRHVARGKSRKPVAVWGRVDLADGGVVRGVMWEGDVNRRRACAKTKMVWDKWPEEMWKKTLLHNMGKDLPKTRAIQTALDRDNEFFDLEKDVPVKPSLPAQIDIRDALPPPKQSRLEDGQAAIDAVLAGSEGPDAFRAELDAPDDDPSLQFDDDWNEVQGEADAA